MTATAGSPVPVQAADGRALLESFLRVRRVTESLCATLRTEDYVIQSMPDVSPTKWHLAHTSWFFEQFILDAHAPGYVRHDPSYAFLFNSYYEAIGPRHCRPNRGLVSRPTVDEVYAYRRVIDERLADFLTEADATTLAAVAPLLTIGLQHEQQHQELLVTDIKHVLSSNPLLPAFLPRCREPEGDAGPAAIPGPRSTPGPAPIEWIAFADGVYDVGASRSSGVSGGASAATSLETFVFDNETPRHRVFLEPYALASRPVTNAEFLAFVEDDGYARAELWLSLGWATVSTEGWTHPLYWYRERETGGWMQYTAHGPAAIDPAEPVCHLSFFEADAYARWADARLPTEAEWEVAALTRPVTGHFADSLRFHPRRVSVTRDETGADDFDQLFGDVWEWTASSYEAYPGFRPPDGALGEYNAKFMCNQYVLRGGSCATPAGHIRPTYRNFFPPDARWQFSGIRLARRA